MNYQTSSSKLDDLKQPFNRDRISVLGGDEIMLSYYTSGTNGENGITSMETAKYDNKDQSQNFTQTLSSLGTGPSVSSPNYDIATGQVATADVDGNYRSDFLSATTGYNQYDGIILNFMEYGTGLGTTLLSTRNGVFGGPQTYSAGTYVAPSVYAYKGDGDYMSEFIVAGYENNAYTAYVFDDLMQSVAPNQIQYGEQISLKNSASLVMQYDQYLQVSGNTWNYGTLNNMSAPDSFRLTFVKPNDTSSTDIISYGDPIYIKDQAGRVLKNDNFTGSQTFITDTGIYNDSMLFYVDQPSTAQYSTNGDLYANAFLSIYSATGGYLTDGAKIANASAIPTIYQNGQVKYVAKLQPPMQSQTLDQATIVTGNLDSDPYDEIIMTGYNPTTYYPEVYVYDDMVHNFQLLHVFNSSTVYTGSINAAIGDVNGDGVGEIILHTSGTVSSTVPSIDVYEGQGSYNLIQTLVSGNSNFNGGHIMAYDIDEDGIAEIFYLQDAPTTLTVFDDQAHSFTQLVTNIKMASPADPNFNGQKAELAFGDINSDGYTNLVVSYSNPNPNGDGYGISVFNWDFTNHNVTAFAYGVTSYDSQQHTLHLAVGDFYGDKIVLEYANHSSTFTTAGEISLIAAAPPNQLGLSQNYAFTGTTFSTSTSSANTAGKSVTSGYSSFWEVDLTPTFADIVQIGPIFTGSVNHELSTTNTVTKTVVMTDSYGGGNLDDFILYTATTYHAFDYYIKDSRNPNIIGNGLTLNLPVNTQVEKQTLEAYNSLNRPGDFDIGSGVFSHVPGQVNTYQSKDQLSQQSHVVLGTDSKPVGQGGGYRSVSIDISTDKTSSFETTISTDNSYSFMATFFGVGGSGGYSISNGQGSIYENSIGTSTVFEGAVGDISDINEYGQYKYNFGMLIYQQDLTKGGRTQSFYVVNYYVDLPAGWSPPVITSSSGTMTTSTTGGGIISKIVGLDYPFLSMWIVGVVMIPLIRKSRSTKS